MIPNCVAKGARHNDTPYSCRTVCDTNLIPQSQLIMQDKYQGLLVTDGLHLNLTGETNIIPDIMQGARITLFIPSQSLHVK